MFILINKKIKDHSDQTTEHLESNGPKKVQFIEYSENQELITGIRHHSHEQATSKIIFWCCHFMIVVGRDQQHLSKHPKRYQIDKFSH